MSGQKDFFQDDYEFMPYLPYPKRTVLLIQAAVVLAWQRVCFGFTGDEIEDEITLQLEAKINEVRDRGQLEGFSEDAFQTVTRGASQVNYNLTSINKQPDLAFRLVKKNKHGENSTFKALFVECKPVDAQHSIKDAYLSKGVIRFVNGDYAWAMPQAMVLGYVFHKTKSVRELHGVYKKEAAEPAYMLQNISGITSSQDGDHHRFDSTHRREWKGFKEFKPGEITLFHMWLTRPSDESH